MTDGRDFQFAAVPLPDGNALFTMLDVTDSSRIEAALRERADALEEADRVKTDFVANMSYELRTPLTSIGGFAELLGGGYAGDLTPKASDYVGAILESVERLSRLINDVLDLTTGDTRGVLLEKERVDVAGLCRAAVDTAKARAAEKGQKLEAEISPARVMSSATRGGSAKRSNTSSRTRSAIPTEGADHADRRRRQEAGGDPHQRQWHRVSLPKDCHVYSTGSTGSRETGVRGEAALGLGLPLTRQFIEAHGGTVELESNEGQGTTVTLTIPRGVAMILRTRRRRPQLGARLPRVARAGDVITLSGPLGVGKTALARGLIAALGHAGRSAEPELSDRPALRGARSAALARRPLPDRGPCRRSTSSGSTAAADAVLLIEWPERAATGCVARCAPPVARLRARTASRILTAQVPPSWEGRWPPR